MKQVKRISAFLLALMMTLSLCACSSARKNSSGQAYSTPGEMSYSSSYNSYSDAAYEMAYEEAPMPMPDYDTGLGMSVAATAAKTGSNSSTAPAEGEEAAENPDKIIYSVLLYEEVHTFRA